MKSTGGFTIMGMIIGIAIFMIVTLIVVTGFAKYFWKSKINTSSEDVISFIRKAQDQTLAGNGGFAYGIHVEEDKMILFRAPVYSDSDPLNKTLNIPSSVRVSGVDLNGGGANIIFQKITGETLMYGVLTLESRRGPDNLKKINIYESGIIEIE